ncbi:MAG: type II secretion system secretin GspD [Zetaproteobacteria bacterium]|nr:type II secretion system secretin GspD [Zetaproteobacteria bacterium]
MFKRSAEKQLLQGRFCCGIVALGLQCVSLTLRAEEGTSTRMQRALLAQQQGEPGGSVVARPVVPAPKIQDAKGKAVGDEAGARKVPVVNVESAEVDKGAESIPEGESLVEINFPDATKIQDIIKAVATWSGKNIIFDRNVNGEVQIIAPRPVTKEEAYQAFLSALSMLELTTVETGKVIKIMKANNARKDSIKAFSGRSWAPRSDELITHIIPLHYVDASLVQKSLAKLTSLNAVTVYEPTNTLIISDTGHRVRRVLEIIELLDVQTEQPRVAIVPIRYSDPKSIADRVNEILGRGKGRSVGAKSSTGYNTFKILTDDRSNSVIIFGPPRTIDDVKNLVKKFDIKVDDPSAQASIHVRPLDYANAQKLAGTLGSLASGGNNSSNTFRRPPISKANKSRTLNSSVSVAELGDGVKIVAEESSNSLLITGNKNAYDALNTIVRKLDVRRSQVFVEAEVLDISETNNFGFGLSIFAGWGSQDPNKAKSILGWEAGNMAPLVVSQATSGTGNTSQQNAASIAQSFAKDMTIGFLAGQKVNVPGLGEISPGALINMVKGDVNTKSLASPHILTSNNEEAVISVGQRVFFRTSKENANTGNSTPSVEKEDVELSLTLKPNISHSGYVTMKVELDANSLGAGTPEGLPSVNKRKTKQNVTVKDGQTIVISGLKNTSESEAYRKIPLLGDIPILGWLFRNSTIESRRSNLVIFLTPHIIHGAADLAAIYRDKVADRDAFLSRVYGESFKQSDFYRELPVLQDGEYRPTKYDEEEERIRAIREQEAYQAIGYGDGAKKSKKRPLQVGEDVVVPVPHKMPRSAPEQNAGSGSTGSIFPPGQGVGGSTEAGEGSFE